MFITVRKCRRIIDRKIGRPNQAKSGQLSSTTAQIWSNAVMSSRWY
jgi:hypothetical protein